MEATIRTSKGDIKVELYADEAPVTVENFTGLASGKKQWSDPRTGEKRSDPLYQNVLFHRVIEGFMIQTGDPLGTGTGGPGYAFADEIVPELQFDQPYLLGMANTGRPVTNGSQFFITQIPTPWLNGKHTIFGKVVDEESKAVVDAIAAVETNAQDRPLQDVVLLGIDLD